MGSYDYLPRKLMGLALITVLVLAWLPAAALAEGTGEEVYAWDEDLNALAWSESDQIIILNINEHTREVIQLPVYENLVRVIISMGFSPEARKLFVISLVDEPDIDSTVMEIHILTPDGDIISHRVIPCLAEASWTGDNELELVIYKELSGEESETVFWDLQTGQINDTKNQG